MRRQDRIQRGKAARPGGQKRYVAFISLMFALLVFPFAGMFMPALQTTVELESASSSVQNAEGEAQSSLLRELGDFFSAHFALRGPFLTAYGRLKEAALGTSPGDSVVIGKDGWLFYGDTLDDYFGREVLSARDLFMIANNIRLIQDGLDDRGTAFMFVLAANKNSVYPQFMPDSYLRDAEASNASRLIPFLDAAGVRYADLREAFEGRTELLYYRRDSHWNDLGAAVGFDYIMDKWGMAAPDFSGMPFVEKRDHRGDLEKMLLPSGWYFETCPRLSYDWSSDCPLTDRGRADQPVETENPDAAGALTLFGDSFGAGLLPYFAECFGRTYYTEEYPIDLKEAAEFNATAVVLERVERNLAVFTHVFARMEPRPTAVAAHKFENVAAIEVQQEGSAILIHGGVPEYRVEDNTRMFIAVDGVSYEAFLIRNDAGAGADCYITLDKEGLAGREVQLDLMTLDDRGVIKVASVRALVPD